MKTENKKYIVSMGLRGFPFGTAPIQKLRMMGRALVDEGNDFHVLSNSYVRKSKLNADLKKSGSIDGINYSCTSPSVFTPKSIVEKLRCRISGKMNEILFIIQRKRKKKLDAVFVYCNKFVYSVLWGIFLRLIGVPVFLVYFELRSTVSNRSKWYLRLNDKLYDRFIFYFYDGFFIISDLLIEHLKKYVPKKPYLYVPPLVDFEDFKLTKTVPAHPYFLFCGSLAYIDVVEFIIQSYKSLQDKSIKLFLVVNGDSISKKKLERIIKELDLTHLIEIYSGISNSELYQLYVNALALLIPLRNTIQDNARFPHKIAEYCAAARPIISTKTGEIPKFFDDSSALLAADFEVELFTEKLRFVIENPERCEEIAKKSYDIGMDKFNYKSYSSAILQLISNKKNIGR